MNAVALRQEIERQHAILRTMLWAASSLSRVVMRGLPDARAGLVDYIAEMRAALEEHLAAEETLLLPLLDEDPALGPVRAEVMLREHTEQRAELAELSALAAAGETDSLVARLARLTTNLLLEMENEEKLLADAATAPADGAATAGPPTREVMS